MLMLFSSATVFTALSLSHPFFFLANLTPIFLIPFVFSSSQRQRWTRAQGPRATLNQLPGDDEPFSARSEPISGYSGTPRSQQQVGSGGASTTSTKTRATLRRPPTPLGSVPWQTTMGAVDVISRPPNPEPAELHRGPKYNHLHAVPSTSTTRQLAAAAVLSNN